MLSAIYVENAVVDHPRTLAIIARYKDLPVIYCEHYGEIFNRSAQNFRLQKTRPALILAHKDNRRVMDAPADYGIGEGRHFYFSHMLNCVYDCRYCFLQGMYRSANYVLFVNFEDFAEDIRSTAIDSSQMNYFYSGYDCDSLAFEPVTGFVENILPVFDGLPNAILELRTKSTQVRGLLSVKPIDNCVVAFSLSPDNIANALEHKAPSLEKRLAAIVKLQQQGWKVGLRFDPVFWQKNWQQIYADFFQMVFSGLDVDALHSVSLGAFRLPENFFNNIVKLYPQEALFAGNFEKNDGMMSYAQQQETELLSACEGMISHYVSTGQYFPCYGELK